MHRNITEVNLNVICLITGWWDASGVIWMQLWWRMGCLCFNDWVINHHTDAHDPGHEVQRLPVGAQSSWMEAVSHWNWHATVSKVTRWVWLIGVNKQTRVLKERSETNIARGYLYICLSGCLSIYLSIYLQWNTNKSACESGRRKQKRKHKHTCAYVVPVDT